LLQRVTSALVSSRQLAVELPVDARQVALSTEQGLLVLERSGELIGVTGQVGFFSGKTILCRLELGGCGVQEVVEALEEPDAISRRLGLVERAGSRVLQGIASLWAPYCQAKGDAGGRPHRHGETAIAGDRRRGAGVS